MSIYRVRSSVSNDLLPALSDRIVYCVLPIIEILPMKFGLLDIYLSIRTYPTDSDSPLCSLCEHGVLSLAGVLFPLAGAKRFEGPGLGSVALAFVPVPISLCQVPRTDSAFVGKYDGGGEGEKGRKLEPAGPSEVYPSCPERRFHNAVWQYSVHYRQ
jgi:hypothetical protein